MLTDHFGDELKEGDFILAKASTKWAETHQGFIKDGKLHADSGKKISIQGSSHLLVKLYPSKVKSHSAALTESTKKLSDLVVAKIVKDSLKIKRKDFKVGTVYNNDDGWGTDELYLGECKYDGVHYKSCWLTLRKVTWKEDLSPTNYQENGVRDCKHPVKTKAVFKLPKRDFTEYEATYTLTGENGESFEVWDY